MGAKLVKQTDTMLLHSPSYGYDDLCANLKCYVLGRCSHYVGMLPRRRLREYYHRSGPSVDRVRG